MAYVITICGAGGKTTKCFELANYYINNNMSVVVTTTTHMFKNNFFCQYNDIDFNNIKKDKVYFTSNYINGKCCKLNCCEYEQLCKYFDVVIIEADGSNMMPMKVPNLNFEPVIPNNVNKIIVLMGLEAVGRKISIVSQRYFELKSLLINSEKKLNCKIIDNTIIDKNILISFINYFYINNLKNKFVNANVDYEIVDITKNKLYRKYKSINLTICASGLSKRFGFNKLLYKINNKYMYEYIVNTVISEKQHIKELFKSLIYDIDISISFVTLYESIIRNLNLKYDDIDIIYNKDNCKGLSESIKVSLCKNKNADAICFLNADIQYLTSFSLANMFLIIYVQAKILVVCV